MATISAREVLQETAERTRIGLGVCVGRKFPGIEWKVIRIRDQPIRSLEEAEELPQGEIGELLVRGGWSSPPNMSPAMKRPPRPSSATATACGIAWATPATSMVLAGSGFVAG